MTDFSSQETSGRNSIESVCVCVCVFEGKGRGKWRGCTLQFSVYGEFNLDLFGSA